MHPHLIIKMSQPQPSTAARGKKFFWKRSQPQPPIADRDNSSFERGHSLSLLVQPEACKSLFEIGHCLSLLLQKDTTVRLKEVTASASYCRQWQQFVWKRSHPQPHAADRGKSSFEWFHSLSFMLQTEGTVRLNEFTASASCCWQKGQFVWMNSQP